MTESFAARAWLAFQYGDADRLRIRHESHARYSENRTPYFDWLLHHLEPIPELTLLDVGCGHGAQHLRLRQQRMRIVGVDLSAGMLREARDQAAAGGLAVALVRGSACSLPLADACADRAMANHMLYHVPDPRSALRELRRVLRRGGRLVIGANASDSGRRLIDLHDEAARRLGYHPLPSLYDRFSLSSLELVREVFPTARLRMRNDAFVFPDADAALRYYASALIDHVEPRPADGSHRALLLQGVASEIRKIVECEGCFRVPKSSGCFVAVA